MGACLSIKNVCVASDQNTQQPEPSQSREHSNKSLSRHTNQSEASDDSSKSEPSDVNTNGHVAGNGTNTNGNGGANGSNHIDDFDPSLPIGFDRDYEELDGAKPGTQVLRKTVDSGLGSMGAELVPEPEPRRHYGPPPVMLPGQINKKQQRSRRASLCDNSNVNHNKQNGHDFDATGMTALLVDDIHVAQKVTARALKNVGLDVKEVAGNGQQAVDLCKQAAFDVVLMDVNLPILDGIQATRLIRDDSSIAQPIVFGLTGNVSTQDLTRYRDAGMNGCIEKGAVLRHAVLEALWYHQHDASEFVFVDSQNAACTPFGDAALQLPEIKSKSRSSIQHASPVSDLDREMRWKMDDGTTDNSSNESEIDGLPQWHEPEPAASTNPKPTQTSDESHSTGQTKSRFTPKFLSAEDRRDSVAAVEQPKSTLLAKKSKDLQVPPVSGPLRKSPQQQTRKLGTAGHNTALIVDDVKLTLKVAKHSLGKLHFSCETASDGLEAVQQAIKHRFQLILMDVNLPNLDGLGATRQIRAHEKLSSSAPTIIVGLTGSVAQKDLRCCLEAGMNGVIEKGSVLASSVGEVCEIVRQHRAEAIAPPPQKFFFINASNQPTLPFADLVVNPSTLKQNATVALES